ncbi:unnamed protein product [Rotaria sp. Silwood1]|nr:unnamed protein product [Rotaria sp. Silwood1]CAF4740736.1 unnamed protein product [Rotaria sp. Silwood1]
MILMTVIHLLLLLVALSSSITTSFEQFGLKIYSTVSQNKKNENIFVSPASISLAMSMCTVGAQQEILNQMLKTSDIKQEDFENEVAQAVQRINAWVEQQANNLIRDLLSIKDVTLEARLIIINTNGKISKVALMHQREKFAYAESNDLHVQIVHVPYKSENEDVEFVFMVILPNRGVQLDVVEQKLLSHQSTRT